MRHYDLLMKFVVIKYIAQYLNNVKMDYKYILTNSKFSKISLSTKIQL